MSVKVKAGWLKNKNGEKFAPRTLTTYIQTIDGVSLDDKLAADLDDLKTDVNDNITIVDSKVDDIIDGTTFVANATTAGVAETLADDLAGRIAYIDKANDETTGEVAVTTMVTDVDSALSETSPNPIQNKAVAAAIANLGIPTITAEDAGKFMRVSSEGKLVVEFVPNAEEVSF